MSVTATQKQHIIDAHETLKNRGMVYLSGRQNGKTRVISRLQESTVVEQAGRVTLRPRHGEDNAIEFVQGVFYGRSDRVNPYVFMRVILQSLGQKPGKTFFDALKQFEAMLFEDFYKQQRVLAVAIDNGDLLCERAFTIIKYLNEFRMGRKDIGIAAVVAGEFGKMRMPLPFLKRTTEIPVGPITAATEIAQLIETHYPGESSNFSDAALRQIRSKCETTLEIRHTVANVIRKKRQLRSDEVDVDLVNLALAA